MSLVPRSLATQPTLTDFLVYILRDWGCGADGRCDVHALVSLLLTHVLFVNPLTSPSMMVVVDRYGDATQAQLADALNIQTRGIVCYLDRLDLLYVIKLVRGIPWGIAYPLREVRDDQGQVLFSDAEGCREFSRVRPYALGRFVFLIPSDYVSSYRQDSRQKEEPRCESSTLSSSTVQACWAWSPRF